nr:O-antigen ligase family protein [Armatimonas rosea]
MQSLLFEENVFGSLSAFVSLYCLSWFTLSRRAVGRYFWLWGLSTAALFLSVSRGSTVGWVVGVVVLILLWRRYSWRLTVALGSITALAAGLFLFFTDNPKVKFWVQMIENTGALDGKFGQDRAHQWNAGLDIFVRHPSGMGLGSVGYAASRSGAASTIVADGNYIAYLAELGIPGALGLVAMLIGLFWVLGRWQRTTDDPGLKALGMALIAYLAGECVHAVSANVFEYYYTWPVFWLLVGVYVCRCEAGTKPLPPPAPPSPGRSYLTGKERGAHLVCKAPFPAKNERPGEGVGRGN